MPLGFLAFIRRVYFGGGICCASAFHHPNTSLQLKFMDTMATETCLTLHNCLCADHRRIQFSCENSECCQCQIDVRSKTSDGKDDEGSDGEIEEESEWSDGKDDEGSEWSDGEDEEELESSGGEETPSRKRKAETAHQSPVKRAKSGSSASMAQRRNFEAVSAQVSLCISDDQIPIANCSCNTNNRYGNKLRPR